MTAEEFWAHVDKSGDCWLWLGGKDDHGYGRVQFEGKHQLTHRVAWALVHGPIPPGLNVLHSCDNPPCVRDDHLFLGTQLNNMQDMVRKGRSLKGRRQDPGRVMHGERVSSAKLSADQVIEIRHRRATEGALLRELAEEFGVDESNIYQIVHGKTWAHIEVQYAQRNHSLGGELGDHRPGDSGVRNIVGERAHQ